MREGPGPLGVWKKSRWAYEGSDQRNLMRCGLTWDLKDGYEFSWWIGKGILKSICKIKSVWGFPGRLWSGGSKTGEDWTMKWRWEEKQLPYSLFFRVWICLKGNGEWLKDINLGRNIIIFALKKSFVECFHKEKANELPISTRERIRWKKMR